MQSLAFSTSPRESYERLGHRVQRLIASPHVQKRQFVEVTPSPDERREDWARLLEDLESTCGIRIERLDTGAIRIGWREFADAL